jgi:hypothetical protein
MQTITATEKQTTRIRPVPQIQVRPVEETLTTHAGICPICSRETRVGLGREATVYGGCCHFRGIEQSGAAVAIEFRGSAA